jgi:hypothetical protein
MLFNITLKRFFSSSSPRSLLQNHKLFPKVDWERVEAGNYAVVDPVNPGVILYLSEQDYIVMVRVAITSNRTLKVLAGPSEARPDAESTSSSQNSQNSPSPGKHSTSSPWGEVLNLGSQTSTGRRGKRRLLNLFSTRLTEFLSNRMVSTSTQSGTRGISMVQLSVSNIRQWFLSWHDIVSWWSRGSSMTTVHRVEANSFALWLTQVLKRNGINHLIARMKIMLFVVNAYLGGRKLTSTQSLGFRIRLRNGLPAALPLFVRSGIRAGNKHYIHIWTSMLFSYKGILGTWQEPHLATGSIQAPHPPLEGNSTLETFSEFCKVFWEVLWFSGIRRPDLKVKRFFFSTHAGPNHPVTILGAGLDAYLWSSFDAIGRTPGLLEEDKIKWLANLRTITGVKGNYIREWLEVTEQKDILLNFRKTAKMFALNQKIASAVIASNKEVLLSWISTIQTLSKATKKLISRLLGSSKETTALVSVLHHTKETKVDYSYIYDFLGVNLRYLRWRMPTLQRLHNLYEAAGKVRTIAIVDYWTNFVLKPLHDWMFKVLTLLPQDATFNQEGRVRDFASRGYREIWSYDLKSATDLIPLAIYRKLFSIVLPEKILDLWFKLLVDRDFTSPKSTLKAFRDHPRTVRYTTGQPMGALTSWASMALVHHALVLYSAVCVGVVSPSTLLTFRDYMVLGDDVVIANAAVARMYQALMKELHVPLSLAKSHISEHGMFNFANQTYVGAMNCSPVSLREEVNANSMSERIELALRLFRRGWKDLGSRVWVNHFCRLLLPQRVWALLTPIIRRGEVPLVIRWILAVLLTPGTTRYSWAGYGKIALETFLGAQLRKGDLFSMSLDSMGDLIDRHRSAKVLIGILGKWAARIYASFLSSRKTLTTDYKNWVTRVVSVDLEWVFDEIFQGSVTEALARWTEQYRFPLKSVVIATQLSHFNIDDVEAGTGKAWADLVGFVADAEAALPVVPDFSQTTLDVLTTLEVPMGGPDHELNILVKRDRQARESLLRVTNLLGMIDHLTTGTPDFEEAWDFSQLSTEWFSKPPEEK